jgi:hypothetical protein
MPRKALVQLIDSQSVVPSARGHRSGRKKSPGCTGITGPRPALLAAACLALMLFAGRSADAQSWYSPAWTSRQEVTIDSNHVDFTLSGDLTGFPYLVTLSAANDVFTTAQTDGDDILFTDSDGVTKLPHEIELYDAGATTLVAWVRLPVLHSAADTTIYMYYGNPTVASQQQPDAVWDDDFAGVWHLREDGSTSEYEDSTRNDNSGVGGLVSSSDAPDRSTDSIAGYSQDFSQDPGDYIDIAGLLGEPQNITVSGWANLDATHTDAGAELFSMGNSVVVRVDDNLNNTEALFYDGTTWQVYATDKVLAGTGCPPISQALSTTVSGPRPGLAVTRPMPIRPTISTAG